MSIPSFWYKPLIYLNFNIDQTKTSQATGFLMIVLKISLSILADNLKKLQ